MTIKDTFFVQNTEYKYFKKACEFESTIKIIQEDVEERTTRVHFELDIFRFSSSILLIGQIMEMYSQIEKQQNELTTN